MGGKVAPRSRDCVRPDPMVRWEPKAQRPTLQSMDREGEIARAWAAGRWRVMGPSDLGLSFD
jgi:hypothetical protein